MAQMPEERRSNELEFMAIGILLGALLGFVAALVLRNFTLGIGLGVGSGLIISDIAFRRRGRLSP